MALPIFLIPLGLIAYVLFNVFSGNAKPVVKTTGANAFNSKLPSPNLPTTEKNKLEIYLQAQKDSLKHADELNQDPYTKQLYNPGPPETSSSDIAKPRSVRPPEKAVDPNQIKINDRLQKLYAVINPKSTNTSSPEGNIPAEEIPGTPKPSPQLERLISALHERDTSSDPQMQQLNGMLDKIMDIQHPERLKERIATVSSILKKHEFQVTTSPNDSSKNAIDEDQSPKQLESNSFYGLVDEISVGAKDNNTILAVVHETQTITNESTAKLRLLQDIFINGTRIPKSSFIYGKCTLDNDRVNIKLSSAEYDNQVYPISLKVFDTDGLEGISIQGGASLQVAKEGFNQGIGTMGLGSLDPSLAGQATAASIETAKNLLSRKMKIIHFTLKAGHRVLLKPTDNIN